jgi:heptosyltransferase III
VRLARELEALDGKPEGRLTLVRSGGLGDTILLLPTLRLLRAHLPRIRLALVGSAWARALAPLLPFPLGFVPFESSALAPLFVQLDAPDSTGALSAADAVLLYTADPTSPFARNARCLCPGPVIPWPVQPPPGAHAASHLARAATADPIGVADLPLPSLAVPAELREWAQTWLAERLGPGACPAVLHPGSGGRKKCWPAEHFSELAARLGGPVLLLQGPADEAACAAAMAGLPPVPVARAAGLPLSQAAALLARCRLYVGNDSGVSHLAAALGVPTVAVFGPTDPAVWAPLGPRTVAQTAAPGEAWPSPGAVYATIQELLR